MRGCAIHRQWVDGDDVCSTYDFEVETPRGAGSIPMAEWCVVRGGKLVSSRLLFDTAAMAAPMPARSTTRVPKNAWTGYGRFCPLARALDVVGERWTLVIGQEPTKRSSRDGDRSRRLPGIGTSVLADQLRQLEAAGVVARRPGPVGKGVVEAPTQRGLALDDALEALRRWGGTYLADPGADGQGRRHRRRARHPRGSHRRVAPLARRPRPPAALPTR